jgi:hypothetical protein
MPNKEPQKRPTEPDRFPERYHMRPAANIPKRVSMPGNFVGGIG